MAKPSDRALAQALYSYKNEHDVWVYPGDTREFLLELFKLAREIDAAAPEGAQPRCPDCNAAVLFECVVCSAGNYPKPERVQPTMYQQIHRHHKDAKWEECNKATYDQYIAYHQKYGGAPPVRALYTIQPQDTEDAARYRWLRDKFDPSVDDEILWLSGENFDSAIDAARAAGGGGE